MTVSPEKLRGLYAITDSLMLHAPDMPEKVRKAIAGGASIIQLREKHLPDEKLLDTALQLCAICREMGAVFIINDRVELARMVNAHGVHIGKDDMELSAARQRFPGIIGVSCYNSLDRAIRLEKAGADYVAFGSIFPSPTKPGATRASLSLLQEARRRLAVPVCAIGGITPENAMEAIKAGAQMVAVISSLWNAPDTAEQARRFARLFGNRD